MKTIEQLKIISNELFDLQTIAALLAWDQEVYMPSGAVMDRAHQLTLMSKLIHQKETSQELGDLLQRAEEEIDTDPAEFTTPDRALVRVLKRMYEQSVKMPEQFVAEMTQLTSQSVAEWVKARKQSDFSLFAPFLEKIVVMCRKQAEYLGYSDHPYDALLDLYEEELTTADITRLFSEIREPLVDIVKKAAGNWHEGIHFDDSLAEGEQKAFAHHILEQIGYDFTRGRMDTAPHPFMERFGHDDRRVTNRYNPHAVEFIFSALHEGGHALYEQGISGDLARSVLDTGISLGIHESQSRMWENMIGRNRAFWQHHYPALQQAFPKQFTHISVEEFYKRINQIRPGLIRVDADEVTYNLHILIRFEIEKGLIEGSIAVRDLPEIWNKKYKEYLGVDVPNDANGVLQDIHWSHGGIGYFPTYMLGNLNAAQIWHTYQEVNPKFSEHLNNGQSVKIKEWLTEKIYKHGSVYKPKELITMVTGASLDSQHLIRYLQQKYL